MIRRIYNIPLFLAAVVLFVSSSLCSQTTPKENQELLPAASATETNDGELDSYKTETLIPTNDPPIFKEPASQTPLPSKELDPIEELPSATPTIVTRFAVIGDYGLAGDPERDVSNMIKSWKPDFIITTGDNNYPDGKAETIDENIGQYFQEYIFPYAGEYGRGADVNRFFPTLGNHDWNTADAQPYFDYFTLPGNERYYDFIWGPVHLFAIDSDSREPDGVGRSSKQATWLQERLAASSAPWKIVFMHQPPYSSSGDGSIDWAQWPYKEWGADAVLSGHSHVYERLLVDGFPYFVNGLGGGPKYSFDTPIPGSQVRFRDDYGAMLVEATTDKITFQFITCVVKIIDIYGIQK
jgi:hypothetical protein